MTIKDLKPGMKVFIKEDLKVGEEYGGCYFAAEMQVLTGPQTIEEFSKFSHSFRLKGDRCWWFTPEMIDWEKTEKINKKETRLTYDGTTLQGQINGKEIKVVRSPEDKEDLEKAVMMGLLQSLGYSFSDVKRLQNKVKTVWRPKFNQIYYYVEPYGEVKPTRSLDNDFDKKLFDFGNYFKTKEEAEQKAIEVRQLFKIIGGTK